MTGLSVYAGKYHPSPHEWFVTDAFKRQWQPPRRFGVQFDAEFIFKEYRITKEWPTGLVIRDKNFTENGR